jgi:hypothetical protein
VNDAKVINLAASGSRDLALLMHVAVQAARFSVETLGEELPQPERIPGLEYPAFSYMHLDAKATKDSSQEGRADLAQELTQAAYFLHAFGLAELLTVKEGYYIRMLPHVEDFMDYLK